jgi:phage-related protein
MAEGFKVADGYVDIRGEADRESGRRAAIVVTDEAEETGRSRSRRFFAALFTPDPSILSALRTGIPAVLSSPIGIAALTLGGMFAASFVSAIVAGLSLGALGGAFVALGAVALRENEKIKAAFSDTIATISEGMAQAAAPLIPAFEGALAIISDTFTNRVQPLLLEIFTGLAPIIEPLVTAVGDAIVTFLEAIADPAVLVPLQEFFIEIAPLIPEIAAALGEFFTTLADNAGIIAAAFTIAIDIINALIRVAADVLVFFSGMLISLKIKWDTFWAALKTGAQGFWSFLQGVGNAIMGAFRAIGEAVLSVIRTFQERARAAASVIAAAWTVIREKIITPFRAGIQGAITFVAGLPGRVASAIGDVGRLLYEKGKSIIQGFINGIGSMIGAVGDAVSDVVGNALDFLPGSPVKRGPLVVLNQLSTNPGAKWAKMLAEGFNTQMQAFTPALAAGGVGNVTVNPAIANPPVTVHVMLDGREIASTVHAVIDEQNLQMKRAVTSGGSRLP